MHYRIDAGSLTRKRGKPAASMTQFVEADDIRDAHHQAVHLVRAEWPRISREPLGHFRISLVP
jgi:hypothetical protein